jgi:hypothetical protein
LFIIHGIINSVVNGQEECVDLHIYDLVKAFDALWVADCMNDLWDTLPAQARDDRLGLLYQSTRTNMVAVNTAVGQTERVVVKICHRTKEVVHLQKLGQHYTSSFSG